MSEGRKSKNGHSVTREGCTSVLHGLPTTNNNLQNKYNMWQTFFLGNIFFLGTYYSNNYLKFYVFTSIS